MEKSSERKQKYIAVPTSDVEEAQLPAYEEENPVDKSQRRRRRFRFLLIGGAIALLGLTHICSNNMNNESEQFYQEALADYENREPCALRHLEQYSELKQHMNDLKESFGDFEPFHRGGFEGAFQQFAPPHDGPDVPPPPPPPYGHHDHHHKHHKDHHREHKSHRKHHGHKHHDEPDHPPAPAPVPPPPADDFSIHRWFEEGSEPVAADEVSIQDGNKHKKPPHNGGRHHPYEPFCKIDELEATSTVFSFSPEEFKRAAVFLNGYFSRGGHIRLLKSSDESVQDVKVNVTLYTGRDDLQKEVKLSAFDHEGQYAVQIERGHFKGRRPHPPPPPPPPPPHGPRHPPHRGGDDDEDDNEEQEEIKGGDHEEDREDRRKENCLVYNVNIEFPANVDYFEDLQLHIKAAQRIQGGEGIEGIEFGSVKAGLGHGAIIFDGLRAKKLLLGVINGVVMGTYQPSEVFSAGTIRGATKVHIEPTGENINITATSTFGPASVDVPADSYSGDFALYNLFGETSTIQAPNPEDIHVTKFRPTLKAGYYKEEHTGSKIVVAAKLHGGETLTFN